jgi:hypothetical protein
MNESRKGSCNFVKKNEQMCRRPVAVGQAFCWQHARGLSARYKSLTRSQGVAFWMAVLSVLATIVFGVVGLLPDAGKTIRVKSYGDQSPNVIDNQGKVEIQNQQSDARSKKDKKVNGGETKQ